VISGFSLAGCKQDSDPVIPPGGGGSDLIGAWYWDNNQNGTLDDLEIDEDPYLEFKADGALWLLGDNSLGYTYAVVGNTITVTGFSGLVTSQSTYTITGNKLVVEDAGALPGLIPAWTYVRKE
jgi:hypothetical protein